MTPSVPGRRLVAALLALCAVCVPLRRADAVLQAENTVVVVNADSDDSKRVANTFIHLRRIPPANVIYLSLGPYDKPRVLPVAEFRDAILRPVLREVIERGLDGRVDAVVWSCGIPAEIDVSGDIAAMPEDKRPPKTATTIASITGLTFLYQLTLAADIRYLAGNVNFYACRGDTADYQGETLSSLQREKLSRAEALAAESKLDEARALYNEVLRETPLAPEARIELAVLLQRAGLDAQVAGVLKPLVDDGWDDADSLLARPEILAVASREDMRELLQLMRDTRHAGGARRKRSYFSNRVAWQPSGMVMPPEKGIHYLLSAALSVDGERGLPADRAVAMLRRAAAADFTRPEGTVFFMENSDVRTRARRWAFKTAVRTLEAMGVRARIARGKLPPGGSKVAGLMAGSPVLDIASSDLEIEPGAICEHFTSHGGVLQDWASQTPLRDFLLAGAAGSGGTVTEPYAIQAKFPTALMQCHYAAGCTLVEAFLQSITGPYQYLIVGDPLCKPWAEKLPVTLEGLGDEAVVKADRLVLQAGAGDMAHPMLGFMLHIDGRFIEAGASRGDFSVDLAELDEGWHDLTVTAVSNDEIHSVNQLTRRFRIDRGGGELAARLDETAAITTEDKLAVTAALAGARAIELYHNERLVATIDGGDGRAEIDAEILGAGPIQLRPVAVVRDADGTARRVRGRPLALTIQAAARPQPDGATATDQAESGVESP